MTGLSAKAQALAKTVIERASAQGKTVTTAESCTGGLISAALTDVAGSSAVFERGFVTYANEAKAQMLAVAPALIASHGAVSGEVAKAMARGALVQSGATLAVSVTGVAGPGGGSADKPVGLVWFARAHRDGTVRAERRLFGGGSRAFVRMRAVETALSLLATAL